MVPQPRGAGEGLSGHVRARILEAIERSLRGQPQASGRNRKELAGLVPPWEHVEPVLEDVLLMQNPRFWEMIEARRAQPTLSLEEVRKRFGPSRVGRGRR